MRVQANPVRSGTDPGSPVPFLRFSTSRWLHWATLAGIVLVAIGADAVTRGDALWLIAGIVVLAISLSLRLNDLAHRRSDRRAARALAKSLRRRELPTPVAPEAFEACGYRLEPGEICFLDGIDAELLGWYGNPYLARRRIVLAWGSPLAVGLSVFATFFFWRRNRKHQKKAAPRWRNPSPAHLWLTDRGFLLHGKKQQRSWICWRWSSIRACWLQRDGIAIILDDNVPPVKLRCGAAAWAYVLAQYAATGQVVQPRPSR